jgi:hypothetical protein
LLVAQYLGNLQIESHATSQRVRTQIE